MGKKRNEYVKKTSYRIKRYYFYAFLTIFTLVVPFITIKGNHLLLLSFDKKQFHLLGVAFDMQELYLMPFLLMLLFLGIFAVTSIGGRAWCGWGCPQTIFRVIYRDLIETKILNLRKIRNKQKEPKWSKIENILKRVVAIFLWSLICIVIAVDFMWYFVPPEDFFSYLQNPSQHMFLIGFILVISGFLIYDAIFLKEDFCIYICPYSRVQSVLYDNNTLQPVYSTKRGGNIYNEQKEKIVFRKSDLKGTQKECIACEACVTVCPTHIDIRKGLQLECINCLECVDACTVVMVKLSKPSLVQWSSTNEITNNKKTKFMRKSTLMYAIALLSITLIIFIMGREKEHMLLNINKTTQLYEIKNGNKVTNNYLFLFQNTDFKEHTYNIEILNNKNIKIDKFTPFTLSAHSLRKKVVILSTTKRLSKDKTKNRSISITIRAYSQDDPKINVLRKIIFMYPQADKFK